ncbi:MAG: hypothetical protein NWR72_15260 [Bacteroidia bacterium]|nr:hypothetical protein [Bacteroidia bacterium]
MKYLLPLLLLFVSCKGPEPISDIPEIELISVSPTSVKAFEDEIVFTVSYTDGDGDLGTNDDTERNVFIKDERLDVTHEFRLKQLAPADVAITGIFDVTLPSTILVDSSATMETVTFVLYVTDRAGNKSNEVMTDPIEVGR